MSTTIMRFIGRGVVALGVSGGLAIGAIATAPQPAVPPSSSPIVMTEVRTVGFCPFGHNSSGGCRGGSINDNQRVNQAAEATGEMYLDAGECALQAVGKSLWKNRKRPNPTGIALGTIAPAIKCGNKKGY